MTEQRPTYSAFQLEMKEYYNKLWEQLENKNRCLYASTGNYGNVIIQGIPFDGNMGGDSILVTAPIEFAEKWPTVNISFFTRVAKEAGSARYITENELTDLLREV